MLSIITARSVYLRQYSSVTSLAKLLHKQFPKQDPRSLKESRVGALLKSVSPQSAEAAGTPLAELHAAWKSIYEKSLHESAYEEMADPGEQCDGELPSWTRDRLKSEKDRNFKAPSVSAHEAKTRLLQKSKSSQ